MARKRSFGRSILRTLYQIIGGLLGLIAAAFLFLGPLNSAPQVPFDQATGFLALFFTAVLAYFGLELGGWAAEDGGVEVNDEAPPMPESVVH